MTEPNNTEQGFIKKIQALWSAEKMLTKAMPGLIEKATNLGLKKNLALHLAETDQHKVALEAICKGLGYNKEGEENEDMKTILDEGEKSMSGAAAGKGLDAAIIAGALKVEHYEMSTYLPVANQAAALGYEGIAKRLRLTFEEEHQAATKLNFLQKNFIMESAEIGVPDKEGTVL